LVPIQSVKAANAVKVAMDKSKEIIDTMDFQNKDLKRQKDTLQKQVNGLRQSLNTSQRVNDGLREKNAALNIQNDGLKAKNKRYRIIVPVMSAVIVIETLILYFALR